MNNLTRFDNDGIELVINTETGEAFASQAGYARMSGVNYTTIKKRVERLKIDPAFDLKKGEIGTPGGLQKNTLIPVADVLSWLLTDYHQKPTQQIFRNLVSIYTY